ncbi:ECF transporter S component [Clostridium sardiniense]|uniref:ECF transporter S component n=1 Tax=Clostridium sardiniense TaxID=29369 RepID=UPI00195965B9|nr:ECF transporter S component [Clostridium sardiniense]MBM7835227.1 putative membrane protein [Clostridium sardiniense]
MQNVHSGEDSRIKMLVLTGLMIALVFISGSIIRIPTLNGFMQPGDCMVLLSAVLLGKKYGTAAGAIGMALVDILGGYIIWAPFTFIIKGLMVLTVAILIERAKKKNFNTYLVAFIVAGLVDIIGYFICNAIMGGLIMGASNGFVGSIIYATMHIPGDAAQVVLGIVIALPLAKVVNKAKERMD